MKAALTRPRGQLHHRPPSTACAGNPPDSRRAIDAAPRAQTPPSPTNLTIRPEPVAVVAPRADEPATPNSSPAASSSQRRTNGDRMPPLSAADPDAPSNVPTPPTLN